MPPGGEKALACDCTIAREFLIRCAVQLGFGIDWLMERQQMPQFELLDSFDLPDDMQEKKYRGSALKLRKLDGE